MKYLRDLHDALEMTESKQLHLRFLTHEMRHFRHRLTRAGAVVTLLYLAPNLGIIWIMLLFCWRDYSAKIQSQLYKQELIMRDPQYRAKVATDLGIEE